MDAVCSESRRAESSDARGKNSLKVTTPRAVDADSVPAFVEPTPSGPRQAVHVGRVHQVHSTELVETDVLLPGRVDPRGQQVQLLVVELPHKVARRIAADGGTGQWHAASLAFTEQSDEGFRIPFDTARFVRHAAVAPSVLGSAQTDLVNRKPA